MRGFYKGQWNAKWKKIVTFQEDGDRGITANRGEEEVESLFKFSVLFPNLIPTQPCIKLFNLFLS